MLRVWVEYEKIPEVLGHLMEIQALYPDRNTFHLAKVTGFNKLAIMYFTATGDIETAELRYVEVEKNIKNVA